MNRPNVGPHRRVGTHFGQVHSQNTGGPVEVFHVGRGGRWHVTDIHHGGHRSLGQLRRSGEGGSAARLYGGNQRRVLPVLHEVQGSGYPTLHLLVVGQPAAVVTTTFLKALGNELLAVGGGSLFTGNNDVIFLGVLVLERARLH